MVIGKPTGRPRKRGVVGCKPTVSEKGRLSLSPVSKTQPKDVPEGPKTYRLVGPLMKDIRPGDIVATIMMPLGGGVATIGPSEPGELVITKNDKSALEGTFHSKAAPYNVTGKLKLKPALP